MFIVNILAVASVIKEISLINGRREGLQTPLIILLKYYYRWLNLKRNN